MAKAFCPIPAGPRNPPGVPCAYEERLDGFTLRLEAASPDELLALMRFVRVGPYAPKSAVAPQSDPKVGEFCGPGMADYIDEMERRPADPARVSEPDSVRVEEGGE